MGGITVCERNENNRTKEATLRTQTIEKNNMYPLGIKDTSTSNEKDMSVFSNSWECRAIDQYLTSKIADPSTEKIASYFGLSQEETLRSLQVLERLKITKQKPDGTWGPDDIAKNVKTMLGKRAQFEAHRISTAEITTKMENIKNSKFSSSYFIMSRDRLKTYLKKTNELFKQLSLHDEEDSKKPQEIFALSFSLVSLKNNK